MLVAAIAVILFACTSVFGIANVSVASAAEAPLSVWVDATLGPVDRALTVYVAGQASESLSQSKLVISFIGPIAAEQVGQTGVDAEVAHEASWWLRAAPAGASTAKTPVLSGSDVSTRQELADGSLEATVTVPAKSLRKPGAYLVLAEVSSGDDMLASGSTWMGRVAVRETPLDVSFVLPIRLGIHRDQAGAFFDQVLEDLTLPIESGSETLRALIPTVDQLPTWRFTLAIEPILLTQLRDMADGYVYESEEGEQVEIDANDLAAQSAVDAVSDLVELAARDTVEIVTSAYSGADLDLLAAQGWRDGLESVQMGKEELQSTLGIETPLNGAYVPGLNITGGSLGYYAGASVEYVVVSSDVQGSLAEMPALGTIAIRAENSDNDRVTLVFAASALSAAMRDPWDPTIFGAAFAAELTRTSAPSLVIAPLGDYGLMPMHYVQQIGQMLTSQDWIRAQTLEDLLSLYSPDSRPILVGDSTTAPDGYIATRLWDGVLQAHPAVSDLVLAAEANNVAASQAARLLYTAQSQWWARSETSPVEASIGLAYAEEAQAQAEAELSKVTFAKSESPLVSPGDGTVRVSIDNDTDYSIRVRLQLSGDGLTFPDGGTVDVDLQPGRTEVEVAAVSEDGQQRLEGSLLVGTTVVDEFTHSFSPLGLWAILPWAIAAAVLIAASGVYMWLRRRSRKAGGPQGE